MKIKLFCALFYTFAIMISRLTSSLFWDIDIKSLSESDHSGFIIQRVCMFGSWNDWLILKANYGVEKIERELLGARYLDQKTLNYFSMIFKQPKEKFRCYSFQQSTQKHWNY
jgi:hypothetical protein